MASWNIPIGRGINFQIKTHAAQELIMRLTSINYPLKRGLQESWYQVKDGSYGFRIFGNGPRRVFIAIFAAIISIYTLDYKRPFVEP